MKGDDIKDRTREFAIRILKMASALPRENSSQIISANVVQSAISAGAKYRAACRSKSRRDFVTKLKMVEVELDATNYWLELVDESNFFPNERISPLISENNELLAIIVKSITTARQNAKRND
jgi:four helix bundle protein